MTDSFLPLPLEELLDRLAGPDAVPGSGSTAAIVLALSASLVAKGARASPDWDGAAGAAAQALALRARACELAVADAEAYREALEQLGRREGSDHLLGGALDRAARVPLEIARIGADVASLADEVRRCCDPAVQPDVIGAAALAAGAARAAAQLVEANLAAAKDDPRVREANAVAEAALGSARG